MMKAEEIRKSFESELDESIRVENLNVTNSSIDVRESKGVISFFE